MTKILTWPWKLVTTPLSALLCSLIRRSLTIWIRILGISSAEKSLRRSAPKCHISINLITNTPQSTLQIVHHEQISNYKILKNDIEINEDKKHKNINIRIALFWNTRVRNLEMLKINIRTNKHIPCMTKPGYLNKQYHTTSNILTSLIHQLEIQIKYIVINLQVSFLWELNNHHPWRNKNQEIETFFASNQQQIRTNAHNITLERRAANRKKNWHKYSWVCYRNII